ncbi:MAG: hypothetical protein QNJ97_07220 [Myxococcota bacterium]|nr:hypothetical protein [Myxococcota bacterium]
MRWHVFLSLISAFIILFPAVAKDIKKDSLSDASHSSAAEPGISATEAVSRRDILFTIHADLLGFAQWGPTLSGEIGTNITGLVRVRFPTLGALAVDAAAFDAELTFGFGAAAGVRFYRNPNCEPRGFFAGLWLEYYHVAGNRTAYDWRLGMLTPQVELGYRWMTKYLVIGIGGSLGGMWEIVYTRQYLNEQKELANGSFRELLIETILEFGYWF